MARATQRETNRDVVIARVMRNLARRAVNAGPLPVQASDGTYPVVVMLPDEAVGDMEDRRTRIGRDANIVVAYPARMILIAMRDTAAREDAVEVSPDTSMDMLVTYLRQHPDERIAIKIGTFIAPPVEDFEYAF